MTQTIAERSWIAVKLFEHICKLEPNEVLSYGDCNQIARCNILTHRWLLESARKRAQREHGIVCATIRGTGIKRADASGKLLVIESGIKKVRRAGRRTMAVSRAVNSEDWLELSSELQKQLLLQHAQLGGLQRALQPSKYKRAMQKIENNNPIQIPAFLK